MGRRPHRAPGARRTLARVFQAVARDAADALGAPLVEVLVGSAGPPGAGWESAAFAAPGLTRAERSALARALVRSRAGADLPEPRPRSAHRAAACEPAVARLLGRRQLQQLFLPLLGGGEARGWVRVVCPGEATRDVVRACRALAREVSGRVEAEVLRRELAARHRRAAVGVRRDQRALAELAQAKDTLAALHLAGLQLMALTDEAAILGVLCAELLRLGFPSAVLAVEAGERGAPSRYRYAFTSFSAPLQAASERVLGRPLSDLRVDARAPVVARVLRYGRSATARATVAAPQLLGATPAQIRRLERLLGLRHVVVAPLRGGRETPALLVVAARRLRRSDPDAIAAFALQASIALEKARLIAELRRHQAQLASEVARRTAELTRAVAALQELDRRKDNFLANVSHELRTPLVTMLGYTDLLLSEKLGELAPRQRDCLRIAGASGRRLRSFIEELLEFSRYELTRERIDLAALEVREVVHQAVVSMAQRFAERGVALRARVAPGTPAARGDRDRLLQVLTNLLANAERYAPEGSRVRIAAAPGGAGRVAFSVSDQGPGIAPEHLERIFDRLYQVGDVVRPRDKGAGLGLGLAIVRSIVEAHGGRIEVRSRVGRGTSFRFWIPSADERAAGEPASSAPERNDDGAALADLHRPVDGA